MIILTMFFLLTYNGSDPILGPLSKADCLTLKRIYAQLDRPAYACVPAKGDSK